jgi:hypothetical protein
MRKRITLLIAALMLACWRCRCRLGAWRSLAVTMVARSIAKGGRLPITSVAIKTAATTKFNG